MHVKPYAEDELLLQAVMRDGQPRIRVYRPEQTTVVLGRGSNPEIELNLEACQADGVALLRRRGGGCAVVLDSGNVVVSVAVAAEGLNHTLRRFELISDWLLKHIQGMGYRDVYRDGTCDLVLDERKVGGACVYRSLGLILFSATLLISPDIENIERYIKHPPREPHYRGGRAHRDFLRGLAVQSGVGGIETFVAKLDDRLEINDLPPLVTAATY